jgi:hypothetical protein
LAALCAFPTRNADIALRGFIVTTVWKSSVRDSANAGADTAANATSTALTRLIVADVRIAPLIRVPDLQRKCGDSDYSPDENAFCINHMRRKLRGTLENAGGMRAVILERNKLVGRKVARLFASVGASAVTGEEPAQIAPHLAEADVLCADTFDADFVAEQVRAQRSMRGVLWTAEPLKRSLRYLVETKTIDNVLGRKDFETAPRAWEILMVARRLMSAGGPPMSAFLDWGFSAMEVEVRTTADRDAAVAQIQDFVGTLGVPKRVAEMFGELGHELIMNAMYDAPVDQAGRPKYALDRKADVRLLDDERPSVRVATDGSKLVLQIRDPFGRLERKHVFEGLARGLAGEMDSSHGGAGLGMMVCHNASSAMFFDVERGHHTEVTAMFELDMNLRELRTQAKSLHFWSAGSPGIS